MPDGECMVPTPSPDTATVVVDIGSGAGGRSDDLNDVSGALLLPDGRIVVANDRRELRYYDADGTFLFQVGRGGEGPGEFRYLAWLGSRGDTVLAFDVFLRRLSAFDGAGSLLSTTGLPETVRGFAPAPVGVASSGGILLLDNVAPTIERPGLTRSSSRLFHWDYHSGTLSELGVFPVSDTYADFGVSFSAPFAPKGHFAPTEEGFAFSFSDSGLVHWHDETGLRVATTSLPAVPLALNRDDWDAERARQLRSTARDFRRGKVRALDQYEWPEQAPVFSGLLVDRRGRPWVAGPYRGGQGSSRCWTILDREGEVLESVWFPRRFAPFAVGDTVVGVSRDSNDVEHVLVLVR